MGDLIKKIKSNFLGKNSFSVGFNNRSPVEGISRKASPLNGYTPASASFEGASGATSSYKNLMASHYGNPEVPDNADLGKVLSEAVGKVGKAAGQLGAAGLEAKGKADAANVGIDAANEAGGFEEGDEGFTEAAHWWNARRSSKKSVSRKSSSPLNQDDDDTNGDMGEAGEIQISEADNVEGANTAEDNYSSNTNEELDSKLPAKNPDENKTDQDKLIEFCTENPNHKLCTGRNVSKSWTDMTPTERINDPRLKWD